MKKALALSIIIPAYNEERYLERCLDAIAVQTVKPYEVLVVDNNSTDATLAIAEHYSFVRVVHEKRQGVLFAARTGFNTASGDVVCRIDADTQLPKTWLEQIQHFFTDHPDVVAVTGHCYFYNYPLKRTVQFFHHLVYYHAQKMVAGTEILWGSNMAIRTSAWRSVRSKCLDRTDIHEDIDLSLHLHDNQMNIVRIPSLLVGVSMRRGNLGLISLWRYLWPWPKTYWANKRYLSGFFILMILCVVYVLLVPPACVSWLFQLVSH